METLERNRLARRYRQNRERRSRRGATLLHMLGIIATLGVLSAVFFPRFVGPESFAEASVLTTAAVNAAPNELFLLERSRAARLPKPALPAAGHIAASPRQTARMKRSVTAAFARI